MVCLGFPDQTCPRFSIDLDKRVGEVAWLCGVYTVRVLVSLAGVFRVDSRQLDVVFLVIQGERLDGRIGDHGAVGKLCSVAVIREEIAGEIESDVAVRRAVGI